MGRSRRAADHDDDPHGVRAMAASVILLVDVDVAYDGPAVLKLARRHPTGWPYSITTGGAGRLIPLIEEVTRTR